MVSYKLACSKHACLGISESRIVGNLNQNEESESESEPESFTSGAALSLVQSLFQVGGAVGGGIDTQSSRHSSAPPLQGRLGSGGGAIHLFWRCGAPRWPGLACGGGGRQEETTGTKREHYFNLEKLLIPAAAAAAAIIQELQLCASPPPPHEASITVSAALQSRPGSLCLLSSPLSLFFSFSFTPPPPLRHALLSEDDAGCRRCKHNVLRSSSVDFPLQRRRSTRLPLERAHARTRELASGFAEYRPAFLVRDLLIGLQRGTSGNL